VLASVRNLLKQKMTPATFQRTRYWWWYWKLYLPRRAASIAVRRTPTVQGEPSPLLDRLREINVFAPTVMCRVMARYGSDKGSGWHNYTGVYSNLFESLFNSEIRIFELGICRIDAGDGRPGASLRAWREMFPRALVFGADIERDVLFTEDRIETFYCDQLDPGAIHDLWAQPALQDGMDILVEDGLHTYAASISFLESSLQRIRPGGYYVVEDITHSDLQLWRKQMPDYVKRFPNYDFVIAELPSAQNNYDNNLVIIQRVS
jgi:hypothetical protein